ncbi:hypothetical protein V8B97DRAFT_1870752 [Scleroderma yunnanense]
MTAELSRIADFLRLGGITATSTAAIVQQARSCIDNEITAIVLSLSTLRSWRNSLSHISRLPPELLAAIFLECRWQWHREHSSTYTREVPPWVFLSYVCQYWRNVALNCPALWTHLFFVSSKWMDELLRRSKATPLIIHVDISRSDSETTISPLKKALQHMERVQDLWIRCSRNVATKIGVRLTAAAPLLQSLYLSLSPYGYPEDRFEVSKDIFAGIIPCIRSVHLESCRVDWSSPIFNGLTELSLSCLSNHSEMDWDGLLFALGRLSSLRQLYLDNVLPESDGLNTDVTNTESVIKCICIDTQGPSIFLPSILDRFNNHPPEPQTSVLYQPLLLRSLDILYLKWENKWKVVCGTSNPDTCDPFVYFPIEQDLDSQFPLQFVFAERYPSFGTDRLERCIAFCRTLPMTHLNRITIHDDYDGYPDPRCLWTETFGDVPELRVIQVEYGDPNQLIYALQPRGGRMFASALTDIQFKGIAFNRRECRDDGSHEDIVGCLRCLHNALASRSEEGIVLQRLYFDGCDGITKDDLMVLSDVVREVEWTPEVKCAMICSSSRYCTCSSLNSESSGGSTVSI